MNNRNSSEMGGIHNQAISQPPKPHHCGVTKAVQFYVFLSLCPLTRIVIIFLFPHRHQQSYPDFSGWGIEEDSCTPTPPSAALAGWVVSVVVEAPAGAGAPGPELGVSDLGFSAPKTRSRPEAL